MESHETLKLALKLKLNLMANSVRVWQGAKSAPLFSILLVWRESQGQESHCKEYHCNSHYALLTTIIENLLGFVHIMIPHIPHSPREPFVLCVVV